MRTRRTIALAACVSSLFALVPVAPVTAVHSSITSGRNEPSNVAGATRDHIVILRDSASVAAKVNKEASLGNEVSDVFSNNVKGFVAELDTADVRRLKRDPQVMIVEPNSVMSVIDTMEPTTTTVASTTTAVVPSTSSTSTTSTSTSSTSTTTTTTSVAPTTTIAPSIDDLSVGDAIPGEYIVMLRPGIGATAFAAAQADGGTTILGTMNAAINGFGARLSKSQLSTLASDPNVLLIEENTVVGIDADQASPPSWGLDRIDQRSLPLNQNYSYNYTGSGVRAYIIDTGVRSDHREFGGRVVAGRTQVNDGRGTEDCNGHGTHVAGTVGGQTVGVAKAVTIVPIRVLSCTGRGSMFDVVYGVNWMVEDHAAGVPAVANMSLGGGVNTSMNRAVANAVLDGITVVVAAGNNNRNASGYSPASEPSAITVGSTMSNDGRSSFSNWGSLVDLFAPGSSITSSYHRSSIELRSLSGTSMAAPHVAGAAALLLEENPNLTPAQVASDLRSYATPDVVTNPGAGSPNLLLFTRARWTPPAPEAPSAPQALTVIAGVAQASLTWTAPTQTGGGTITDYIVEFSANNGSTWSTFNDGISTATSVTVTGLTNGVTYSFRVSAVNSAGTSPTSDVARATIGVPTVPTGLSAVAGAAQVTLTWTTPSQTGGSAITDYIIEFSIDSGTSWTVFADGTSTATSTVVTGLTNGITHTFRVSATNAVGTGAVSGSVSAVPWQVNVPSAPRDLAITAVMATSISLEWRIPTIDGGGFITGYVVEQSGDGGTTWFTSVVTGTGGRAGGIWFTTVYDLVSGREYRFRVRATNSAGNSEPSSATSARAPGVPSEPEDVRAVSAGPRRIMLRWERPTSDGGVSLRGYTIDYSTDNGSSWTTWSQDTGVIGCTCQYMARTVTDLTDGVAHIFRIKAYNSVGASAPSESTDPMTPLTPQAPGQPLNVVGTATPAIVELDWEEPANDNGAPITDYVIDYSTNSGSTWITFVDGTSTATLASLRGLTAGVSHIFRVSAVNSAGTGLPSVSSTAITPLAPLTNDAFSGATPIVCGGDCATGTSVRMTSSTRSATRETGEPNHGGFGASASLWYSFSIPRAGSVVIDTMGSDFDTLLGVYTGSAVNALATVVTNDDAGGGNWSRVELAPNVGTTYFVAIDGYGGRKGSTVLNWRFTEAPPAVKPGAPSSVRAVAGNAQATIYWSAPDDNGGAVITAYSVTSSPGSRTCTTSGALTCSITGLANGTSYTFTVTATNSAGTSNPSTASEPVTPRNDSTDGVVPLSWGLDRVDQRSLPLDNRYSRTQSGAGVTVYVIDTGVRATHSELTGRVAPGFTTLSDGNGTNDCQGHGTHVAATTAGTNYGVAPAALVVPVRVMNCSGSGSTSDIIAGIDWIISHHQPGVPAVANMSLGGPRSAALDLAVSRGVADGVTFVVAAGNSNVSACTVSPAGEPSAITVGSTTSTDERSSFSNFGSCLDVFAPGSNIVSASHLSDTATRTLSGTSMAAPHVAGVAALALSQNNTLSPAEVASAIATSSTRNIVTNPGTGSLNRMVFSLLTPASSGDDESPATTTTTAPPSGGGGGGGEGGGDGGGGGGGDDESTTTSSTTSSTTTSSTTTIAPTTTRVAAPTTIRTTVTLPRSAAVIRLPGGVVVERPQVPAAGDRPAVGSPVPWLPSGTPKLNATSQVTNGVVRISADVAANSLLHVYKAGVLVSTLKADGSSSFVLPVGETEVADIQVIAVTTNGEVLATVEPPTWTETTTVTTTTITPPATTATTTPPTTTTTTTPPVITTTTQRPLVAAATTGTTRRGAVTAPPTTSRVAASRAAPVAKGKPAAPAKSGKSTGGKSAQRSTNDTIKSGR